MLLGCGRKDSGVTLFSINEAVELSLKELQGHVHPAPSHRSKNQAVQSLSFEEQRSRETLGPGSLACHHLQGPGHHTYLVSTYYVLGHESVALNLSGLQMPLHAQHLLRNDPKVLLLLICQIRN